MRSPFEGPQTGRWRRRGSTRRFRGRSSGRLPWVRASPKRSRAPPATPHRSRRSRARLREARERRRGPRHRREDVRQSLGRPSLAERVVRTAMSARLRASEMVSATKAAHRTAPRTLEPTELARGRAPRMLRPRRTCRRPPSSSSATFNRRGPWGRPSLRASPIAVLKPSSPRTKLDSCAYAPASDRGGGRSDRAGVRDRRVLARERRRGWWLAWFLVAAIPLAGCHPLEKTTESRDPTPEAPAEPDLATSPPESAERVEPSGTPAELTLETFVAEYRRRMCERLSSCEPLHVPPLRTAERWCHPRAVDVKRDWPLVPRLDGTCDPGEYSFDPETARRCLDELARADCRLAGR